MAENARHGAYLCISAVDEARAALAAAPVPALVERLGLVNEFDARDGHPPHAVAFLSRAGSTAADIPDPLLSESRAVIHVASADGQIVSTFCTELERLLRDDADLRILRGTVQPTQYTGGAMHGFAYAHQRTQEIGASMPNAFLLPLRKLPEWWAKDWMERHTYFLPRYDADGRMVSEGHALTAAAGIPALMRRTYRCGEDYDFLTYFECADADVPTFDAVCAALRDVRRNPEWRFVREGPTWRGRRTKTWSALWTASDTDSTTRAR
jgi:hypothetical protein